MSNDLLFSVLPRRGTVPIKSDRGEVKKIVKKTPTHASPEDENLPKVEERKEPPSREQQNNHGGKDYSDEHVGLIVDTTDDVSENMSAHETEHNDEYPDLDIDDVDDKGSNLDITI